METIQPNECPRCYGLLTLTGWCFNCREWPHMKHKQVTISDRTSLEVGQALISERNAMTEEGR
jgi:hypothetical protein